MKKRTIYILGGITIALVLGGIAAVAIQEKVDEDRVASAKERLKSMGYPLTAAELEALKPPANQNAAPFYMPLIAEFERGKLIRMPTASATSEQFIKVSDAEIGLLDRMDQLSLRPKLWFERDYNRGHSVSIDHLPTIRKMAVALTRRATLEASRGNHKRALGRLKTVGAITQHLRSDPTIYGGLQASRLTTERNFAIVEMAKAARNVAFLQSLKNEVKRHSPILHVKDYIGATVVSHANPPQEWVPQDWESFLLTQPAMLKRLQAHHLEMLVHVAAAAQDFLSEAEAAELRELETRAFFANFRFLGRKQSYVTLLDPDLRTREVPSRHILVALDHLIEKAGGPKMAKPSDVKVDVQPNGWIVRDKSGDLMSLDSRTWFVRASGP